MPGSSFLLAHSMRESSPSAGRCPIARGVLFPRKIEPSVSTMPHPSRAVGITKALEHHATTFYVCIVCGKALRLPGAVLSPGGSCFPAR